MIFDCLSSSPLEKLEDLIDPGLLAKMCLEMDKELFKSLPSSILNDKKSFGLLMADLKEIKTKILQVFQTPDFAPKPVFKSELENIDPIQLANKDNGEIQKLISLIALSCCLCNERDTFIEKLESLNENAIEEFYNIPKKYLVFDDNDRESIRVSLRNTIHRKPTNKSIGDTNEYTEQYLSRIKYLEEELKKELDNKEKLFLLQKQLDEANNKIFKLENDNKDNEYKIKHLTEEKDSNKAKLNSIGKDALKVPELKKTIENLTKQIEDKNKEFESTKKDFSFKEMNYNDQIKRLNQQVDLYKEKAISNNELQTKYDRLLKEYKIQKDTVNQFDQLQLDYNNLKKAFESGNKVPITQSTKAEIDKLKLKINEQERKIIEQNKKLEQYEAQIELLKSEKDQGDVQINHKETYVDINSAPTQIQIENKITSSKGNNEIENEIVIQELNMRLKEVTEELDKCKEVKDDIAKYYQKDTNEMQARYQKEFELISSAIYNLGATFYSMKYEYEQKLIKNPNWLIKERQKKFNGDY